jgi:hypothetical protein
MAPRIFTSGEWSRRTMSIKDLYLPNKSRYSRFIPVLAASYVLFLASCGMIPPTQQQGSVSGSTYSDKLLGMSISAPSTDWTVTTDAPDSARVLIIKYLTGRDFNPNVVVAASPAHSGDSLASVTQASIAEFCNDPTFSNKTIFYNDQSSIVINGNSFDKVMANVTKTYYTSANQPATIALVIDQYVTIHNGYIIVFTFMDDFTDFPNTDTEFLSIRESIQLF